MLTETSHTLQFSPLSRVRRGYRLLRRHFNTQSLPGIGWVVALALMKLADAVTTWIGLQAGLVETNPLARYVIAQLGVTPALAGLSVVAVVTIVALIESASAAFRRLDATAKFVPWLRFSWYLLAVATYAIVAGHNAALIMGWA